MSSLLSRLRDATSASHKSLDGAFGSLDLASKADYVRFLRGHAIGMAPLFSPFERFVQSELGMDCPDYPALLAADLAALGVRDEPPAAPAPSAPLTEPAVAYVVAGSRLGLAVIRKGGYWGAANGIASTYMEDEQGVAIWKHAAAWLKECVPDERASAMHCAAAVAAFDTFASAFEISAPIAVR